MLTAKTRLMCLAIVLCATVGCSNALGVEVSNESGQTLSQVVVTYSRGQANIGTMMTQGIRRVPMQPRGESGATIAFDDARGTRHEQMIDVYFESMDRGVLRLVVGTDLGVAVASTPSL